MVGYFVRNRKYIPEGARLIKVLYKSHSNKMESMIKSNGNITIDGKQPLELLA